MYAVVSSGGKQYRVEPGSTLLMERLASQPGGSILFDRVLLIGDGDEVTVGTPVVAGASVSGTVLGEELGPKLVIFKFKQKVKYRRRTGHRQHLLRVRIDEINAEGRPKARAKAKPEADVTAAAETEAAVPAAKAAKPATKPAAKPRASRAKVVKAAAPAEATEEAAAEAASAQAEASAEKPKPKRRSPRPKAEKARE